MTVDPIYADIDLEVIDPEKVTLCADCAKHPSLKRFIVAHSVEGPVCGICQEIGYAYAACDPLRSDELINLIKALVRFYYNEYDYNGHFGGDDVTSLLSDTNPILEDQSTPGRTRSAERSADFLEYIFSAQPYPPPDKGISVYAGFDDEGTRHLNFSLKSETNRALRELRSRLQVENYFDVEPDVVALIDKFASRITRVVSRGARYFRARIGFEALYADHNSGWERRTVRQPFAGPALGSPPPQGATAGRLNRAGVAFLYLASDADTAAAEVRPHPGHFLSVGEFESLADLKIASFDADIAEFAHNEAELEIFHFIYSTNQTMALPVLPDESSRYTITQLIAECLRKTGFDGVSFRSSVGVGQNLCVFRPESFAHIDGSAKIWKVKSLHYELEESPMILKPDDPAYYRLGR